LLLFSMSHRDVHHLEGIRDILREALAGIFGMEVQAMSACLDGIEPHIEAIIDCWRIDPCRNVAQALTRPIEYVVLRQSDRKDLGSYPAYVFNRLTI
jgi:hypothetical protein